MKRNHTHGMRACPTGFAALLAILWLIVAGFSSTAWADTEMAVEVDEVEVAEAEEAEAEEEPAYVTMEQFEALAIEYPKFIVDNLWILIAAGLVFLMHLGFASLESGLTRAKNTVNILTKNLFVISIGITTYAFCGFQLMYPENFNIIPGWLGFGGFGIGYDASDPVGMLTPAYGEEMTIWSDFIFQAMFAATAATIVSGAVAERIKLPAFMLFALLLVAISYPITGSWQWGGGWLDDLGFEDFAGSTLVHGVGGAAALACVILLGPRRGKYLPNGKIRPILGHSMPLAAIGVFLLWLGWFGFNGGSVLSADPAEVSFVFVTTALAAAGGALTTIFVSWFVLKKPDLSMSLNGALAGLVGITAGADVISPFWAFVVGVIAGVIVIASIIFLDKIKIDDPVGAISVHGTCGIWGTLAVGIWGGANFGIQLLGTVSILLFTFVFSLVVFGAIKAVIGVRVSEEEEDQGLDLGEQGAEAYPDFQLKAEA